MGHSMGWAAEAWLVSHVSPLDGSGRSDFRDCSHTSVVVKSGDLIPHAAGSGADEFAWVLALAEIFPTDQSDRSPLPTPLPDQPIRSTNERGPIQFDRAGQLE